MHPESERFREASEKSYKQGYTSVSFEEVFLASVMSEGGMIH